MTFGRIVEVVLDSWLFFYLMWILALVALYFLARIVLFETLYRLAQNLFTVLKDRLYALAVKLRLYNQPQPGQLPHAGYQQISDLNGHNLSNESERGSMLSRYSTSMVNHNVSGGQIGNFMRSAAPQPFGNT